MVSPNPYQGSPILITVTILILALMPSLSSSFSSSSPCSSYRYRFSPPPPPPCCHPHLHNSISSPAPSSIFFLVIFTPIFYQSVLYWYHPRPSLRPHGILIVFAFLVIFMFIPSSPSSPSPLYHRYPHNLSSSYSPSSYSHHLPPCHPDTHHIVIILVLLIPLILTLIQSLSSSSCSSSSFPL